MANVFQIDLNGDNLRRLTAGPRMDQRPAYSPDGLRLAFRVLAKRTIAAALHLDWYFELVRNSNAFHEEVVISESLVSPD